MLRSHALLSTLLIASAFASQDAPAGWFWNCDTRNCVVGSSRWRALTPMAADTRRFPSTRAATQAKLVKDAAYYASKGKQAREALEAKHQEALEDQAKLAREALEAKHQEALEAQAKQAEEALEAQAKQEKCKSSCGVKAVVFYLGKAVVFNALFSPLINYAWTPPLFKSADGWDYPINFLKAIGFGVLYGEIVTAVLSPKKTFKTVKGYITSCYTCCAEHDESQREDNSTESSESGIV